MLADEDLLKVYRKDGTRKIYTLKQKTAAPDTAIAKKDSNQNTLLTKLQRIMSTGGTASRQCAEVLIRFLDPGKMRFSTEDLSEATGWDNRMIHDALRPCKRNQIIRNTSEKQGNYACYQFNCPEAEERNTNMEIDHSEYSDEVLRLISDLEQSNSSTKDRRIGSVLRHCLAKHMVTREGYARIGEESKWSVDMQFASMLGIVTVKSNNACEIMTELASSKQRLQAEHKNTLSLLYKLFGDEVFSAEMVVAQLDYSSGRVSGILHQFTWMKLLHCTSNVDHINFYQFCVNPTDNPEYFEAAA